jgi:cytochrome c biogenesis protein CcdA/thiol-disulfide isomerase/thioredoxin
VVLLIGIAFLAGVVTAVSPCVLPVLPVVFAGGASGGGRRRPLAIVSGIVVAFTASLLIVTWLLRTLGLPEDLLRDLAIALLFVVAAMLIFPQLGVLIERPLARLTRRPGGDLGGGFVLGLSLGIVFIPCGGVIQGYIAAQSASVGDLGAKAIAVTIAYALGVAVPMLAIAYGGRAATSGLRSFRTHAREVRVALGVVIAASAFLIVFHVDRTLQTKIGDYTSSLQHAEKSCFAQRKLGYRCNRETVDLADYGAAPEFQGISNWFNSKPLSTEGLHGKVVLVDFWTYSCINCLRTLPHLKAWWKDYERKGLVIVGVHTPEFAFEAKPSNVEEAVKQLGVKWPVALDPAYGTWKAYGNQYWPAEYLIDKDGHVRNAHFGEGEYDRTERLIRQLLGEPGPAQAELADMAPTEVVTPETYLGFARADDRYVGDRVLPNAPQAYRLPARDLAQNDWAFGGTWTVEDERAISGRGAQIGLHFHARNVYIVLGGEGRVGVSVDGRRTRTLVVSGIGRLYVAVTARTTVDAQLRLTFTPGVSAYSFTFG